MISVLDMFIVEKIHEGQEIRKIFLYLDHKIISVIGRKTDTSIMLIRKSNTKINNKNGTRDVNEGSSLVALIDFYHEGDSENALIESSPPDTSSSSSPTLIDKEDSQSQSNISNSCSKKEMICKRRQKAIKEFESNDTLTPTKIITLEDPFSAQERQYLQIATSKHATRENANTNPNQKWNIYEIYSVPKCHDKYSSFFVNNRVLSNGNLHLVNRVDPLFFILYILYPNPPSSLDIDAGSTKRAVEKPKWQPLEQIFTSLPLSLVSSLQKGETLIDASSSQLKHLFNVSDQLGDDMLLYKFNEQNVLEWLEKKVKRTVHILQDQMTVRKQTQQSKIQYSKKTDLNIGNGAFSSSFRLSADDDDEEERGEKVSAFNNENKQANMTMSTTTVLTMKEKQNVYKSAVQVVCQYLSKTWRHSFLSHLESRSNSSTIDIISSSKALKEADLWSTRHIKGKKMSGTSKLKDNSSPSVSSTNIEDENNISIANTVTPPPATTATSCESHGDEIKVRRSSWEGIAGMDGADEILRYSMGVDGNGGAAGEDNNEIDSGTRKKKGNDSNKTAGLKRLAKVNTKGMKSLSSFFGGPSKKKAKF